MPDPADMVTDIRNSVRAEADRIRTEREARARRHEILQVAGHVAAGLARTNEPQTLASDAVRLATLIVDAVDHAMVVQSIVEDHA